MKVDYLHNLYNPAYSYTTDRVKSYQHFHGLHESFRWKRAGKCLEKTAAICYDRNVVDKEQVFHIKLSTSCGRESFRRAVVFLCFYRSISTNKHAVILRKKRREYLG